MPNPIHGAAVVGKFVKESKIINNTFNCDYINLSTSEHLHEAGKAGGGKVVKLLKIQYKVLKSLLTTKYDLCYVTPSAVPPGFYKDFIIIFILKLFGQKIIYHFHNKGISERKNSVIDHLLYKFSFRNTKTILLSQFLYSDVAKYVKKDDVYICANGIAKSENFYLEKKPIHADLPCRLLFLSNMMVKKGVFVLIDACKILKDKGINFKCDFLGAWHDITEEEFDARIQQDNLTQYVTAHGKKYGEEKVNYFTEADIFIFPTYNETFGLVLLEAMEYALPIVSTWEGGIPDVVSDGETGFLVRQQDSVALAEKIELLISQPELRIQMGALGRKRYNDMFLIEKFENRLLNILKEAVKN